MLHKTNSLFFFTQNQLLSAPFDFTSYKILRYIYNEVYLDVSFKIFRSSDSCSQSLLNISLIQQLGPSLTSFPVSIFFFLDKSWFLITRLQVSSCQIIALNIGSFFQKYRANIGKRRKYRSNIGVLKKHLHVFIALKFIIFYIQRNKNSNCLVHLLHGHS